MVRVLLICAAVSVLLIGCSSFQDRQERAQRILEQTTDGIAEGIEKATELKDQVVDSLSGTTQKIQATATELKQRAQDLQDGVDQIVDAVQNGQEGIQNLRGALNVSGE